MNIWSGGAIDYKLRFLHLGLPVFKLDDTGRRGHSKTLFKRRSRLDIRKYVFADGIVDNWNVLLDTVAWNHHHHHHSYYFRQHGP